MGSFNEAFGGEFEPHRDEDAAIKFILNNLMMDNSMDRLVELLDISHQVGCIEGEPGWELERIEEKDRIMPGYAEWPSWACFRAYVDPEYYELVKQESYYSTEQFKAFTNKAIHACLDKKINLGSLVDLIDSF